jgi:hypothetical protein
MLVFPSIRPTVRVKKLSSHWKNFYEILYLNTFRKSVHKILVSLKSDKNRSTLREDVSTFMVHSWLFFIMGRISDKSCWESKKPHTFPELYSSWDKQDKCSNVREAAGENITWHMRFACWVTKAKNHEHTEYATLIAFQTQQWLGKSILVILYTYIFIYNNRRYITVYNIRPYIIYNKQYIITGNI